MFQNYASGGLKKDKRHNAFRNWEEEKKISHELNFFMLKQDLSAKNNSVAVFGLLVVAENVV